VRIYIALYSALSLKRTDMVRV